MVAVMSTAVNRCLASPSSPIARILDQPGLCPPLRETERQRNLARDHREGLRAVIDRKSPADRLGQWLLRMLLEKIISERATMDAFEVEHEYPRIGRRIMLLNARGAALASAMTLGP